MNRFTAAGYVEPMPPFPIHVSPLVIGRIDEFTITEGQPVEAGQIIAKLNPEEFEKRLAELKATLSVNAGEPLPFERLEDLPANLRPLVVTGDPEAEENEPSGAFELNTLYQMTSDGRLGRKLQREVASHFEEAFVYGLGTSKCDARLRTQFREFLESRGIFTRSPEPWDSAGTPESVDTVYIEISEQSKGISEAEGEARAGLRLCGRRLVFT